MSEARLVIPVNDSIILRSYRPEDASVLFNLINTNRKHLNPWLPWVGYTTKVEHSLEFIEKSLQELHAQEALALGIYHNGNLVGGIGMHGWDRATNKAMIGYWLAEDATGKGILFASAKAFVHFLFNKLSIIKIEIHFSPANTKSAKVAERLGCKIEGVIRQSAIRNGMIDDVVIAGLLRSEFK